MNRQNAFQFWDKKWGRKTRSCDFAGRQIEKSAYMDEKSAFGWCLVPICDTCQQMVCMHIKTWKEKGTNFPKFTANHKQFQVAKLENQYGIIELLDEKETAYLTAEQAIRILQTSKLKEKEYHIHYIHLHIQNVNASIAYAILNLAQQLFGMNCIYSDESKWVLADFHKKESQEFLDQCVLFNTYVQHFIELYYPCIIQVAAGTMEFEDILHVNLQKIIQKEFPKDFTMCIDENLLKHTNAINNAPSYICKDGFYSYNYTFTTLRKKIEKLVR